MDVGDRVVYVLNDQIDLNRDVGTIVGWATDEPDSPRVLFDDGDVGIVGRADLMLLVEKRPVQKPMHLHFGCSENPCPWPGHS
jgi:hypothetical protein